MAMDVDQWAVETLQAKQQRLFSKPEKYTSGSVSPPFIIILIINKDKKTNKTYHSLQGNTHSAC